MTSKTKFTLLGFCSAIAVSAGTMGASAQEAPAPTPPTPEAQAQTIVVTGRRLSQQEEAIGVDETSNTVAAKYLSDRYSNFTNTEEISDFTIVSGYVDIGEGNGDGLLGHLKARINVDNIFDVDELAFITPTVTGPASFRPQSPRTFSISVTGDF